MMFDGRTFDPEQDGQRLTSQLERVKGILLDGKVHQKADLMMAAGVFDSASLTARIRDLRKEKFGGYDVVSKRVAGGIWCYQMIIEKQRRLF